MAVPKKKKSHRKQAQRRAHWKLTAPTLVECPRCRSMKRPHHVCPTCGHYDGRQVLKVAGAGTE
ncbi:50S ribosomal protein L32 [Caldinitratiruptor microaerophilus]|uniref:Large ribosomal subunit protein bL32 n=1 Tax=Caldinitratiruptor microaerophilus TaxID=671077 RepID=A0AA35G8N5_9FIRM|nr:50S ribosomal protein L32 [Caldinitratiruptor microaerophilus]BDG60618.1 50S ribosomal protein L32 [Caldinitratiruptor microaerophilus]